MPRSNKAASGDLRALQLLSALIRYAEERAATPDPSNPIPEQVDERIVLGILERMGAIAQHYKVDPAKLTESHAATIDYVVAATAG